MQKLSLRQRALLVSDFCSKNDIEYLTYHVPVPRNEGRSLSDARSHKIASDLILATIMEAKMVHEECRFENKIVIVHHLPSVISLDEIPYLNKEHKFKILENAEKNLLDFYMRNSEYFGSFCTLTLENVFPKYFTNGNNYATANMFHPLEMIRLRNYGIKLTFDFSHYNIYSNYLSYGKDNLVGDLDRQIYGMNAPSWNECIDLFADSLIQLHINNGKGTDFSGEGMNLLEGEIPIIAILRYIEYGRREGGVVQATVELKEGHLYNGKHQAGAAEWLLVNAMDIFY